MERELEREILSSGDGLSIAWLERADHLLFEPMDASDRRSVGGSVSSVVLTPWGQTMVQQVLRLLQTDRGRLVRPIGDWMRDRLLPALIPTALSDTPTLEVLQLLFDVLLERCLTESG